MRGKRTGTWSPDPEQMALWPEISGNTINRVGKTNNVRPTPIYWHPPEATAHGQLQTWFYKRFFSSELIRKESEKRQVVMDEPLAPLNNEQRKETPDTWSRLVKEKAIELSAEDVGICQIRPEWVYEDMAVQQKWAIVIAVAHDYEALKDAPEEPAAAEVVRQYGRSLKIVKDLASWIRQQGWDAEPKSGPLAGAMLMIPAAIEAGLGELGKHGSMINRHLGSNFRIACVLTDLPLTSDKPDVFGADDFCTSCKVCSQVCPPDAISKEKQWVRGTKKWYVNFDKCLPFFNENRACAICLAVCPWSRPGVAKNLVEKLKRRAQAT